MRKNVARTGSALLALCLVTAVSAAAQTTQAGDRPAPPAVGEAAPDFELPGASRYGLLKDPIKLSDFHGKTVVLAFFFRARSSG